MANTDLILGLAGIFGTLTASGIGYTSTAWLERRRERREAERQRTELRTAARLTMDELARNGASADHATPAGDGLVRIEPLAFMAWDRFDEILTTIEERQAWFDVSAAYTAFGRVVIGGYTAPVEFVPTLREQTDKALAALARYA